MDATVLRVLLIGNDGADPDEISGILQKAEGVSFDVLLASDLAEAEERLGESPFDLALLALPPVEARTVDLHQTIHTLSKGAPLVILAQPEDEANTVTMIRAGAEDVLPRQDTEASRLVRTIRHAATRGQHQRSLQQEYHRYLLAVTASNDGLWDWNLKTDEVYYSLRWAEMLGYAPNEIGSTIEEWVKRVHPDDRSRVEAERDAHLKGHAPYFVTEHRILHKDGTYRWMLMRGMADHNGSQEPTRMAGSLRDISDRKIAEEQLRQGAFYDTLTGLPNRAVLLDRLGRSVEQA